MENNKYVLNGMDAQHFPINNSMSFLCTKDKLLVSPTQRLSLVCISPLYIPTLYDTDIGHVLPNDRTHVRLSEVRSTIDTMHYAPTHVKLCVV